MSSDSETEGPTPAKRRNYDLKFKLNAVLYAEKHNKSKAAKDLNVNRQDIQKWVKQKDQLTTVRSSSTTLTKRLEGAGRHLKDGEFDKKLVNWVHEQRQKKLRVSRTRLQKQALLFSNDELFKVSHF